MNQKGIELGMTAIARAGATSWFDGHFGAGVLAAERLLQRQDLSVEVKAGIRGQRDRAVNEHPALFEPFPAGPRAMDAEPRLVQAIRPQLQRLSLSGHGVIYGAMALETIRRHPQLATEAIIAGIVAVIERAGHDRKNRYHAVSDYQLSEVSDSDAIAVYDSTESLVLTAFEECKTLYADAYVGPLFHFFTAEKLHGITFAHAIVTLEKLGFAELAKEGFAAHRLMMKLNRMVPPNAQTVSGRVGLHPHQKEYWQKDHFDDHALKLALAGLELVDGLPSAKRERVYDPATFWGPFQR